MLRKSIEQAISRSNIVINLLGKSYETRNFSYRDIHVSAAQLIAEACASKGVERVIHLSSLGSKHGHPSQWASTKAEGEEVVRKLLPHSTILRSATIFGYEDQLLNKFGKFNNWALPIVPLLTRPSAQLQPIYVGDVASAVVASLSDDATQGKTYQLGGPTVYTMRGLVEEVILPHVRSDRPVTPIPYPFNETLAKLFALSRSPLYIPEEIKYWEHTDEVVPTTDPTVSDLGVTPSPLEQHATSVLRQYRKPSRFDEETIKRHH
jgi:nucleoside-diphosphate-sugar epimerase